MGDVGSATLGFLIGALALKVVDESHIHSAVPVVLLGVFLVDATFTLVRRMLSGEVWYSAHRSHAYQKLAIRWGSHRPVTLVVCAVNIGWLLPMATWIFYATDFSGLISLMALLPLLAVALWLGAGRSESAPVSSDSRV